MNTPHIDMDYIEPIKVKLSDFTDYENTIRFNIQGDKNENDKDLARLLKFIMSLHTSYVKTGKALITN